MFFGSNRKLTATVPPILLPFNDEAPQGSVRREDLSELSHDPGFAQLSTWSLYRFSVTPADGPLCAELEESLLRAWFLCC